jgi:hypothetical protein
MDFTEIDSCMAFSWRSFRLWYIDTDMQLKAIVPDEGAGSALFWKIKW